MRDARGHLAIGGTGGVSSADVEAGTHWVRALDGRRGLVKSRQLGLDEWMDRRDGDGDGLHCAALSVLCAP